MVANLQGELQATRDDAQRVQQDGASLRHEAERCCAQASFNVAEATRREQEADAARAEMAAELDEYRARVHGMEAQWATTDRAVQQQLGAAEEMRNELVTNQEAVKRLEAALAEAHGARERAASREAALQAE
eukprot:6159353-Prymnesium_polylepis.1